MSWEQQSIMFEDAMAGASTVNGRMSLFFRNTERLFHESPIHIEGLNYELEAKTIEEWLFWYFYYSER